MACHAHLDSKTKAPHLQRGETTEQLACKHLQASGLKLLQQNYRLKMGEIDLIMRDGDTIVFVEVRYRKSNRYGGALYSIDPRKQMRLLRTAQHYLQSRAPNAPARFDVIAVDGSNDIHWVKNAFESC
ncbi:MAG: YraN family protein [Gammaproteobacteria bacterium]|nr:YraN family protein [Gammaproteobacteria bacterium]MBU1725868.1 YraN family protein [Gammaproteobacteria bacterium]MBU2005992.1 YraN family protein [Gammaproteobacteria bacterium]